jgi:hypothetical protein
MFLLMSLVRGNPNWVDDSTDQTVPIRTSVWGLLARK